MNDTNITGLDQVRDFVTGSASVEFRPITQADSYQWIGETLRRFDYFRLRKKGKTLLRDYLQKVTNYSHSQLTRLIKQYKKQRSIGERKKSRHTFPSRYTKEDILLLAQTDECHQTLSGPATKKLFERAYKEFNDNDYQRLSTISVAHIYNLRKAHVYQAKRVFFTKTQRSKVMIGERRKPFPNGQPGYLRIDTVHQGDLDGEKGVYYINAVDEVTQMEVVCAVEKISENFLIPVLEDLINIFPFEIKEIHSDNGSEYINKVVSRLLKKLLIELTKSRSRQTNDNALVEGKNGAIVRKWLGYNHIPQYHAEKINEMLKTYMVPYINFHRPCHYVEIKIDPRTGKEKKIYPYKNMMTPYEKFKSLENASSYLKKGLTFEALDILAKQETDLESAKKLKKAREKLFQYIAKAA